MNKIIQVSESVFDGDAYLTVLDSRGLLWTAQCRGLPFKWLRVNSPPGCVGEFNEGEDEDYHIKDLKFKPDQP